MLTINPASLRAIPHDTAAPPTPMSDASSDPAGFSSLLRQSQAASPPKDAPPPPASTPAAPASNEAAATAAPARAPERAPDHSSDRAPAHSAEPDTEAPAEPGEPAAGEVTDHGRALPKTRLRGGDAATAARAANTNADAPVVAAKPVDERAVAAHDTTADTTAVNPQNTPTASLDPNIAQWLAALQHPATPPTTATPTTATRGAQATTDTATPLAGDADAPARSVRAEPPGGDAKNKIDLDPSRFAAVANAAGLATAQPEARAVETAASAPARAVDAADRVIATPLPATVAAAREVAAPVSVGVPTRVDAPDFAQVLGVQMSVLAKDGIQQAELHLNPAEMGPVSVQIVMDGTQARIDFGADMAATRHAIEAGLPELASALRDAGFTLAGGGVSQHSGSRGDRSGADEGSARRGLRRASDDSVASVSTVARRIVTNGGLDLYA